MVWKVPPVTYFSCNAPVSRRGGAQKRVGMEKNSVTRVMSMFLALKEHFTFFCFLNCDLNVFLNISLLECNFSFIRGLGTYIELKKAVGESGGNKKSNIREKRISHPIIVLTLTFIFCFQKKMQIREGKKKTRLQTEKY